MIATHTFEARRTVQRPVSSALARAGLLQRKCACGGWASPGGECEECRRKRTLGLQPKLRVNQPGDEFEQEADRVAESVINGGPVAATRPAAGTTLQHDEAQTGSANRKEPSREEKYKAVGKKIGEAFLDIPGLQMTRSLGGGPEKKPQETPVQRKATSGATHTVEAPSIVHDVLQSPGQPLDAGARAFMESRFRHDFSRVRVHLGTTAEQSALEVNAHAYTVGHNIVFSSGQYAPRTVTGQKLLAHELAHVLQQTGDYRAAALPIAIDPEPRLEAEAERVNISRSPLQRSSTRLSLQRQTPPGASSNPSLPTVDPSTIPQSWRNTPLTPSGGRDVYVYRGFARSVETHVGGVVREGEIGGILSRRLDAAQDAIFNQVGRDPVLSGPQRGGVVRIRIPSEIWDELVRTNSVSERGGYPGFSRAINSTEIRVNSAEAGRLLNNLPKEVLPPDPYYDFRPGASRPAKPQAPAEGETVGPQRASTPPAERATVPPEPATRGPEGAPGTQTAPTEFRVNTQFRVLNATTQPNGNVVSEVEAVLGEGLEQVNRTATANGARNLPARILLRITTNPEGALVSAESTTGEATALAETLARQALATFPRVAAGAEGAAGAAAGTVARVSPWVRGVGWAGVVLFIGITAYQYRRATPAQRPRVLATAGGGLVGGAASGYVVCNVIFGIETLGWSLLGCLFVAGIPGGVAGSAAAGAIYDEAAASPIERELHRLQGQPTNVRRLFYAMVERSTSRGGLPMTEGFISEFIDSVPANLADIELETLTSQFRSIGPTDTLEGILIQLRRAISNLPARRPVILPPILDRPVIPSTRGRPPLRLDALGGGRIQLGPILVQPPPIGAPTREPSQVPGIQIQL